MSENPQSDPGMYDAFAEEFLEHARDGAYNAYYDRPAVLAVVGSVRDLAVLDVGCGPGLYAESLVARGASRVVGVDASAAMVRLAAERVRGPVEFRQHDLNTPMSWATDGEFDVAVMPLVLPHVDDRVGALREIARLLRPGGRLVVSTHHPMDDWRRLGGSYFTVERVRERWNKGWDVAYWRQPLDVTCDEFSAAGFLIERVHEPRPSAQLRDRYPDVSERLSASPAFIVFSLVNAYGQPRRGPGGG
ncbi:class I SAM-dependent methyltransferase [Micromonospora sp. WMMD961]|uniref:class I SAM-dependent methyltransferase n=1 Tax=Micromonospora sp. WMMD961 TaxID=3016100 RepID=UPI002417C8E3|nr:class I SAM-dependent methyltransferase [Micromonospora sp. WMMD961]MDG4780783.1 class I SAM-dependent methyltransferase [Micromonospora sp. WMMD961]